MGEEKIAELIFLQSLDNCLTKVILHNKFIVYVKFMHSKMIGIRELHRNLKRISQAVKRGQSFVVLRNTTPLFRIEPLTMIKKGKKYTLADLKNIQFPGPRDLSMRIDEFVYGGR